MQVGAMDEINWKRAQKVFEDIRRLKKQALADRDLLERKIRARRELDKVQKVDDETKLVLIEGGKSRGDCED